MKIKYGTTRITILIGNFALKTPIVTRSIKHFVKGWLGNIDERDIWKKSRHPKLCPVYFSFFGLINVMPRAQSLPGQKFSKQFFLSYFKDVGVHVDVCSGWKNFGYLEEELYPVILDYATCRESSEYCSDCDKDCILKK